MISGLAGVLIFTDDLERLAAFYQDALGLTPHSRHDRSVAFRWGDVRLTLSLHDQVAGSSREPYRIMLNLHATDIHGTYARLSARGVAFIRPPELEPWGGWIATFRDPDGNLLQLLEYDRPR